MGQYFDCQAGLGSRISSFKFQVSSLFDSQVIHKYNNMSAVITINILQFYGGVNDSNIVGRKKIEKGMGGGSGT